MPDDRMFTGTYDLYRPTVSTSASGDQSVALPNTPTAARERCLFFPSPAAFSQGPVGVDIDFDAVMLVPSANNIRPSDKDEQPDHVRIGCEEFVVKIVWNASGRGQFKRVLLERVRVLSLYEFGTTIVVETGADWNLQE